MSNHVYKKLEIIGTSPTSVDDAIRTGIAKTSETIKNLRWFEVGEIRGEIEAGQPAHFQVTMRLGFTVEE